MLEARLKKVIQEIPDFPKPGISFKDISPLFLHPDLLQEMLAASLADVKDLKIDVVAGIESRGFLLGVPLAMALGVPFVPIRKVGKLPRATFKKSYGLEYGQAEIELHQSDIVPGQRVLIHDDLLATGGTAQAAAQLIQRTGAEISGFHFLLNLSFLSGAATLEPYAPVKYLVGYGA
jgi:adenine phosphoribosyltransferase